MLIHTLDFTACLAPVMFFLALATIVCGAVLLVLAYDARRADQAAPPVCNTAQANQPSASSLDLRASGSAPLAA
jgi:hypothetical protein